MSEVKNEEVAAQFIGPRRVMGIVTQSTLTNAGAEIVEVLYDGGHKEKMPLKAFNTLVTEQPTDWNVLRDRKLRDLTMKILMVLAEHDLKAGEIEALKVSLEHELYNAFNRATNFLWTQDDGLFTPGTNVVFDRSLLEADRIIKSIPQNVAPTSITAPEGGEPEAAKS